jgi:hypothetical protein
MPENGNARVVCINIIRASVVMGITVVVIFAFLIWSDAITITIGKKEEKSSAYISAENQYPKGLNKIFPVIQ